MSLPEYLHRQGNGRGSIGASGRPAHDVAVVRTSYIVRTKSMEVLQLLPGLTTMPSTVDRRHQCEPNCIGSYGLASIPNKWEPYFVFQK